MPFSVHPLSLSDQGHPHLFGPLARFDDVELRGDILSLLVLKLSEPRGQDAREMAVTEPLVLREGDRFVQLVILQKGCDPDCDLQRLLFRLSEPYQFYIPNRIRTG